MSFLGPHIETWGPIGLPIRTDKVDVEMHTDAGEFGYGGHPGDEVAGVLPERLVGKSSTHRELYGLRKVAATCVQKLAGKKVKFLWTPTAQ